MRNINYVVIDAETGLVKEVVSIPPDQFPLREATKTERIVVPADGILPGEPVRFDLRKVRKTVNAVETLAGIMSKANPEPIAEVHRVNVRRNAQLRSIDALYADRMSRLLGPLGFLHAEKLRQAEAGGGPLIVDETDRQAILANAEAESKAIAALEQERRSFKVQLRSALTIDQIEAIMPQLTGQAS